MDIRRAAKYVVLGQLNREHVLRKGFSPRGYPIWTKAEDNTVRRLYPDYEAIGQILTRRSYHAIRSRASRLKLPVKKFRWTAASVSRLRRIYPTGTHEEILAAFPGAKWEQVANMRKRMKIYRRRSLKKTGYPIVDQIRSRAKELNFSIRDLNLLAKTSCFFSHPYSKCLPIIDRALAVLDGEVRIIWH